MASQEDRERYARRAADIRDLLRATHDADAREALEQLAASYEALAAPDDGADDRSIEEV